MVCAWTATGRPAAAISTAPNLEKEGRMEGFGSSPTSFSMIDAIRRPGHIRGEARIPRAFDRTL